MAVLALLLAAACAPDAFRPSPHERYARSLRAAGLDATALGHDWSAAATTVLAAPTPADLPLRAVLEVPADKAWAVGYRFALRRGQRLSVRVTLPPGDSTLVFADLFDARGPDTSGAPRRLASAPESPPTLDYEVRRDGPVVLRLQCELLRGPTLSVRIESGPSLAFPVERSWPGGVISRYGDARAGGRRRHQGIDIAAPRGTPALAATEGRVTSAGTNPLGGNVVWVFDPARRLHLYYAHLDRHAVSAGERVEAGDTVGLVGTSGNAEGTRPHLHFGIYGPGEGALDPHPFVVGR